MKTEYIILIIITAITAMIIATFIFGEITTVTFSIIPILGVPLIIGGVATFCVAELYRWLTPQIITKTGHYSYRPRDIKPIPWTEMYVNSNNQIENIRYGNMLLVETGGIEHGGIFLRGKYHHPVILAPAKHFEKIGDQICCRTNLSFSSLFQHNLNIQKNLESLVNDGRIKIKKKKNHKICNTRILYGITSSFDKSDTADIIQYENLALANNELVTFFKNQADTMREEYERNVVSKNTNKNPIAIIKNNED